MANIDRLQWVSEAVWELPISYKTGMRVPARIYGMEKLGQTMDDAVYDEITKSWLRVFRRADTACLRSS